MRFWSILILAMCGISDILTEIYLIRGYEFIKNNTNPIIDLQQLTPKLVNNMSSGVPVPSLRHQFSKLEWWRPLEALAKNCKNTIMV